MLTTTKKVEEKDFSAHIDEGMRHYRSGHNQKALTCFQSALGSLIEERKSISGEVAIAAYETVKTKVQTKIEALQARVQAQVQAQENGLAQNKRSILGVIDAHPDSGSRIRDKFALLFGTRTPSAEGPSLRLE